jgi:hypothetical protein
VDICVTVPKGLWPAWIEEGDLPGEEWSGFESHFWIGGWHLPKIHPGERVYVVAHGKLRGYAPLVELERHCRLKKDMSCLLRRGGAVAVTIDEQIRGFQGWRYVWWQRYQERPFPNWREVDSP